MLLIKNATLVDYRGRIKADIYMENGLIAEIGDGLNHNVKTIDASGKYVFPAFVDLHAHLRYPGYTQKEDIESGTLAAAYGGYTTLNAMANTRPVCSSLKIPRDVWARCAESGYCDVYQTISMTDNFGGEKTEHLDCLVDDPNEQLVKFVSDDGNGVANPLVFYEALLKCKQYSRVALIHAEEFAFSETDMYAAEDLETIRDLYLAKKADARIHFCHVSTEFSARAITEAAKNGVKASYEVTPHHIALTDTVDFRVNPPLRRESDRQYLISAIKAGEVFAIATDHAPHTKEDKKKGAPGLVGLETAFPVCYTTLVKNEGVSLETLSLLMSKNPAHMMGINKGELRAGAIADVVIAELETQFTVEPDNFKSKSRNTPFAGMRLYGRIENTIKNGEVIV